MGRKGTFDLEKWRAYKAAEADGRNRESTRLRNELVEENRPLVVNMATQFRKTVAKHCDLQDLIQSGCLGLIRALADFQPDRGGFGSYAHAWIHNTMQEESLRDATVYRSRSDYLPSKIQKKMSAIYAKEGRDATHEDLGITEAKLSKHYLRTSPLHVAPLDSSPEEGHGRQLSEKLSAEPQAVTSGIPQERLEEIVRLVHAALSRRLSGGPRTNYRGWHATIASGVGVTASRAVFKRYTSAPRRVYVDTGLQLDERFAAVIGSLSEDVLDILYKKYVGLLTYREIAKERGESLHTVAMRITNLRRRLSK